MHEEEPLGFAEMENYLGHYSCSSKVLFPNLEAR